MNEREQLQEDFISNVTLHGFRYLFTTRRRRRLLWWIFFMGALLFSVVLFKGVLDDYFQYNSYIVINDKKESGQVEFPKLTFCYNNPFTESKFDEFPIEKSKAQMRRLFWRVFGTNRKITHNIRNLVKEDLNNITYEELVQAFTFTFNDTSKSKVTQAISLDSSACSMNNKNCSHRDFQIVLNEFRYPCLQYNYYDASNLPKLQRLYDRKDGFEMYFDLNNKEAIQGVDGTSAVGMILFINSRATPFHQPFSIDISLEPGTMSNIIIEKLEVVKRLPPPHGQCGERKLEILKGYPYSLPTCRLDCKLQHIVKRCGCVAFDFKRYVEHIPVCSIEKMRECYILTDDITLLDKNGSRGASECMKECIHECVEYKHPLRVETSKLGVKRHIVRVQTMTGWKDKKEVVKEYIEENVVGVRVSYKNIVERLEVTTPSVTTTSLLGTIGGSIGLGLGFSLLTLVEFLFFILDYICLLTPGKKKTTPEVTSGRTVEKNG